MAGPTIRCPRTSQWPPRNRPRSGTVAPTIHAPAMAVRLVARESYDDTRMRAIERLLIQLNAAYGGPAWHGPSLRELLDGVTEEQARARPIANAHSILEIVVHVQAWMDAVSERLAGSERELTTEEDWSDVARTSWPAVLDELDNAESRVCDAVARLRPEDLDKPVAGKRYSVYVLVHGLIQHNLYHAGQIS